jgi:iron complex outermembrane receptor protein
MKRSNNIKLMTLQVAAASLLLSTGVQSQESRETVAAPLEEILVTARKRSESLQDVPMAIDAFDAQRIEQLNIRRTEDLAKYTPALTFDVGALPNDTRPVIRGVNAARGRPNVAVLVDFIDVSSEAMTVAGGGITANLRALDLERIEVVKGPQSVLYGRSAFSGAINYITRRPSSEFEGSVEADYDEHNTYSLGLSVSGPLIQDTLGGRLTLSSYNTDGWYENPNTGGDLGNGDSQGGSLALEWTPSEDFNAYLRVEHSEEKYAPRAEAFVRSMSENFDPAINPFATGSVTDAATQLPYDFNGTVCNGMDRQQPYFDSFGAGPACRPVVTGELSADDKDIDLSADPRSGRDFDGSDTKNTRVSLDLDWQLDSISLRYLMGYTDSDLSIQQDFDMTDYKILSFPPYGTQFGMSAMSQQEVETTQWSHEFRVSADYDRWHWMASALYWQENMDVAFDDEWWMREGADEQLVLDLFNQFVFWYLPPPGMTYIATGPGDTPATPLRRDTEHWSIAASVSFDITDALSITAEGRYLDETIKYAGRAEDVSFYSLFGDDENFGYFFGPGPMTHNEVSETEFVPRVTVDWALNDDQMLYAYVAKGFKPGGISTVDANGDVSTGEYGSESIWTYEIGYKSLWRDDSLRFNAAAFYYDYTDQQVPYFYTEPATGLLNSTVINAGKTEVKGVELELVWNSAFVAGLSANISYVYSDAEYTDFNTREILAKAGGVPDNNTLALAGNVDGDFGGNQVMGSPEHAAVMGARYEHTLGSELNGYLELLGRYESKRYVDLGNRAWLPSRWAADLFAGVSGDKWDATLYVTNLLDEDAIASGVSNVDYGLLPDAQNVSSATNLVIPQPRTVGLRASYRF